MKKVIIDKQHSNYYYADKMGNIYSIQKDGSFRKLNPYITEDGYRRVQLAADVENKHYRMNRVIAETYLDNPNGFPIVHHKNGIRHDDRVENLEWANNSYNQLKRYEKTYSESNVPVLQTDLNTNEVIGCYLSMKFAGQLVGTHPQNISKVCRKLRRHAGGFGWEYAIRV